MLEEQNSFIFIAEIRPDEEDMAKLKANNKKLKRKVRRERAKRRRIKRRTIEQVNRILNEALSDTETPFAIISNLAIEDIRNKINKL